MAPADFCISRWMQGIMDLIVGPFVFTHDQKPYILIRIVEHRMRYARAWLESNRVAGFQSYQVSVQPNIRRPFDHIYELFFRFLRMWPACPAPRRKHLMMHSESLEPKGSSKRTSDRKEFITPWISGIIGVLNFGPMANEIGASCHGNVPLRQLVARA